MPYLTDYQFIEQAAAAGFKIGDYVHHPSRDHRAAMPIENFEWHEGQLMAVLMLRCVIVPFSQLRLSTGHKRPAEFGPEYQFFTSASELAEALYQAKATEYHLNAGYTGAWVKKLNTGRVEIWLSNAPEPGDSSAVFCLYTNAPWREG